MADTRPARPGEGGPSTRPSRPERPGIRPERPDRPGNNRPGEGGIANRPGGRPGDRPSTRPSRPTTRPGDQPGRVIPATRPAYRPDRIPDWDHHHNWQHDRWSHVNNHWHQHWSHYHHHFDNDWCYHHPHWHCYAGFNYWGVATWPVVVNWMPWGWSEPYYYNYGQNVYFQDNTVYYGSTPVATTADYIQQAEAIATNLPETPPAEDSWMPLGVFGMVADSEESTTDPTMFLQLAVSKEGMIAGTFKNVVSGATVSIEGMVDKESQRAAWTEVGKTRPLMECGFSNLTQDTVTALMHYADGTTQRWLLIRMEPPTDSPQPSTSTPRALPPQ